MSYHYFCRYCYPCHRYIISNSSSFVDGHGGGAVVSIHLACVGLRLQKELESS